MFFFEGMFAVKYVLAIFKLTVLCVLAGLCFSATAQAQDQDARYFDLTIEELMHISVATRDKREINKAPSVVTLITAKEIKNMGARDLRDVLRFVPGFQVGISGLGYTTFGVRGIATPNAEKVKILIDGLSVNDHIEGGGAVVFGDMGLENVERIEIIRGPGSALYGTSAFLAVINIITKKAADISGLKAYAKSDTFNKKNVGILAGKQFNDLEVSAYFDYLDTDGPDDLRIRADALSSDPLNRRKSLAGTSSGYADYNRWRSTSSLKLAYKGLYFNGLYTDKKWGGYLSSTNNVCKGSEAHVYQLQGMLGYRYNISDAIDIDLSTFGMRYDIDSKWSAAPPGYIDNSFTRWKAGQLRNDAAVQKAYGGEVKLSYAIADGHSLQAGAALNYVSFTDIKTKTNTPAGKTILVTAPLIMARSEIYRRIWSGYFQYAWDITDRISLTAGVRADEYSDFGDTFNPRFGLVWEPIDGFTVKALYGRAFRAPTFVESYIHVPGSIEGDNRNSPEIVKTYELELGCRFDIISVRLNYFYNVIEDLLATALRDDLLRGEYANMDGRTIVQGIEAEIKVSLTSEISGYLSYAFQSGENKATDTDITGMARHVVNAGFNVELFQNFNLNMAVNHVGSRKRAESDSRGDLGSYTFGYITLINRGLIKNLEISLSLFNAFNSNYRVPEITGNVPNDYPLEERSLHFGMSYSF